MAKRRDKLSVAYTKYTPKDQIWHCYNRKTDKIVGLADFTVMMMKNTKKYKPFYLNDFEITELKKKRDDLKTLRLYRIKDKAYQHIKDRATIKEINHPFGNNDLFIDCYLNYNTEQYSDNVSMLDAPDIQTISKALSRIFTYYDLNRRVDPIVNDLDNKKISLPSARDKIEKVISGREIRYIPFGSPLQKALSKAIRHAGCSYRSVLGGCDSNMFGLFYMEDKDHNIIKDMLDKE